ncbi:MAG TPA: hypothetical protein VMR50_04085 [Myxococcota bacterium]|nr:hypothetical protein [Myxococcota bacterium]
MSPIDRETRELVQALRDSPRHGPFIRAVECAREPRAPGRDLRLAIVPGILYREHPETGADGQLLREVAAARGWSIERVELAETGRLTQNAAALLDWLERRAGQGPWVLVSLSKGAAEVWHALQTPRAAKAFARVSAWVSVSGIPLGTAFLDHVVENPLRRVGMRALCAWKGWDYGFLADYARGRAPARAVSLPDELRHLRVYQVAGFPTSQDFLDRRSRASHRRLAARGPNDGFVLLRELCELPGVVYPVAGADHYLRQIDRGALVARVLDVIRDHEAE